MQGSSSHRLLLRGKGVSRSEDSQLLGGTSGNSCRNLWSTQQATAWGALKDPLLVIWEALNLQRDPRG